MDLLSVRSICQLAQKCYLISKLSIKLLQKDWKIPDIQEKTDSYPWNSSLSIHLKYGQSSVVKEGLTADLMEEFNKSQT